VDDREIAVQFSERAQNLSLMQNIYTGFEAFSSSVQLLGQENGQFFAPGGQVSSDGDAWRTYRRTYFAMCFFECVSQRRYFQKKTVTDRTCSTNGKVKECIQGFGGKT
jgi:hypothetical protein